MKNLFLLLAVSFCTLNITAQSYEEWDDYFMPGIGYKVYTPKNHSKLGVYQGIAPEFVIYARAKTSESGYSGPARVKIYGNLSIMKSDNDTARDLFSTMVGLNLSFEGGISRRYFIPYFGLELGGMYQRDFSSMQFTPVAGIQLISTKHIIWNAQAGYNYTVRNFDEYSGMQYSSTVNILLWNK